jgi:hypothetical protein
MDLNLINERIFNMVDANIFLGMGKRQAQNYAEQLNLIFRLIRVDDKPMASMPTDVRTDRVCIEIDNLKVTKATIQ